MRLSAILVWLFLVFPIGGTVQAATLPQVIDAVGFVESGNNPDVEPGDGGRAIGQYQIHYRYWFDATHRINRHGKAYRVKPGDYQDCLKPEYARQVMLWYWRRYNPAALKRVDADALAGSHNGHFADPSKTAAYRRRVMDRLRSLGQLQEVAHESDDGAH